jgi:hypothetical protein
MTELFNVLGASFPFLLLLSTMALYFQSRSDRDSDSKGSGIKVQVSLNRLESRQQEYAAMPLDRLVPLYCRSGLTKDAKRLVALELKKRGWVERTLETGRTVLVEPLPPGHDVKFSLSDETLARVRAALRG